MKSIDKKIDLKLSLKPEQENIISKVQKELMIEDLERFGTIEENDVNISTSYVFDAGDVIEASIFFRNGLSKKINFDRLILKLVNEKGKIVGSQMFELSEVGEIPPYSIRPYKIQFNKDNIIAEDCSFENYKVVFDTNLKVAKTVVVEYEEMPENINIDEMKFFQGYLQSQPKLEYGQVDIKLYDIRLKEDKFIKVTILIRNGTEKKVKLEQLPITIYDSDRKIIYSSVFVFKNLEVSILKAKLFNFMINCSNLHMDRFKLGKLSAELKSE